MGNKVAILGAGNGGHALAFHLTLHGAEVMLYENPNFRKNLDGIRERGGIEAIPKMYSAGEVRTAGLDGFAEIRHTTVNIKEAMDFSDIIIMIVPAFAQEIMFNLALPHLRDGHNIILFPGNFGSIVFKKTLREKNIRKKVLFAETMSIPHACRIVGPGQVFILGVKDALEIAAMPAEETDGLIEKLKDVMPLEMIPLQNILEAGFSNPNMVAHVATTLLNMGLSEARDGQFFFYKEGMSPSVSKVQQKLDDERMAVGKAFHLNLISFVDMCNLLYSLDCANIRDFAVRTPVHNAYGYDFPTSPKARYVSEDCPYLMVPMYEFARMAGVETPAMKAIITIASIMNGADYFKTGRTLDKMGLFGITREQIIEYVDKHIRGNLLK